MSEAAENVTQEAPEAPVQEAVESPEVEEAAKVEQWVGSIKESAGLIQKPEPSEEVKEAIEQSAPGGEKKAKPVEEKPVEQKAEAEEPAQERPSRDFLDEQFRARSRARKLEQDNQELSAQLAELKAKVEALQGQPSPVETVREDPEPDFDLEPKEWYDWRERQTETKLAARIDPVVKSQEQAQKEAEAQRQAALDAEQMERIVAGVRRAEEDYEATVEGQGYRERLNAYQRFVQSDLVSRGASESDAATAFGFHMLDLMQDGARSGRHPVAFIDDYMSRRAQEAAALAGNPPPAPERAAPKPQPTKKQQEAEQELASTAALAQAPEASGAEREATSAGASPINVATLARSGQVTPNHLREMAARTQTDPRKLAFDLMRAADG